MNIYPVILFSRYSFINECLHSTAFEVQPHFSMHLFIEGFDSLYLTYGRWRSVAMETCLHLSLDLLHEDVPLQIRQHVSFMHDVAPAHFSRIVRNAQAEEDQFHGLHVLPTSILWIFISRAP